MLRGECYAPYPVYVDDRVLQVENVARHVQAENVATNRVAKLRHGLD